MLLRLCAILGLATLLASPALAAAADMADADYTTKYFGTVATFTLATPLALPDEGYWTDKLPLDIMDAAYIASKVNPARTKAGRTDLIADTDAVFQYPDEEDHSSEGVYQLAFAGLRPSEVQLVLASLNNLGEALPGAQLSYSPLKLRNFDVSAAALDQPLVFNEAGVKLNIAVGANARQIHDQLAAAFKKRFGADAAIEYVTYIESLYHDDASRSVSFNARIGPAPAPPAE